MIVRGDVIGREPPKARGNGGISYNWDGEKRQRWQVLDVNLHWKSEENGGVWIFRPWQVSWLCFSLKWAN